MNTLPKGRYRVYWYDYPTGQGAYGSGGWSRHAKHRPQPVMVIKDVDATEILFTGKSVVIAGVRKLKCTIVSKRSGEVLRADYDLERIKNDLLTNSTGTIALESTAEPSRIATAFGGAGARILS
jgi:hypothetical protein